MMTMKTNAANERIKRDYLRYLRDARGRNGATLDRAAKSLARFELATGAKDFRRFHREQAMAFKRKMAEARNARTGENLSKATIHSTLRDLKSFFEWLSHQPGFKTRIAFADADYFNLSEKDATIARTRREKMAPTLDQVERVLSMMPGDTALERRDRALIAFTMITGARVNALASFLLGHVDLQGGFVEQDARDVRTKFAKSFRTYFMPVSSRALEVVDAWVRERREEHMRGPNDPLFPATKIEPAEGGAFAATGLERYGWKSTGPIRDIFRRAFEAAALPYCNPHSFRDMLVRYAMALDLTPAQMKAWSQNLGHSDVMTTFTSYGAVPVHRQGELIRAARLQATDAGLDNKTLLAALQARLVGKD